MATRSLFVSGAALILSGCAALGDWMEALSDAPIPQVAGLATVTERSYTGRDGTDNGDSAAARHGPDAHESHVR